MLLPFKLEGIKKSNLLPVIRKVLSKEKGTRGKDKKQVGLTEK